MSQFTEFNASDKRLLQPLTGMSGMPDGPAKFGAVIVKLGGGGSFFPSDRVVDVTVRWPFAERLRGGAFDRARLGRGGI